MLQKMAESQAAASEGNWLTVDIQSVATGKRCTDREPAFICICDSKGAILLETCIRGKSTIVSTIEPYTGLKMEDFAKESVPSKEEAIIKIRNCLNPQVKLVSQGADIFREGLRYFGLEEGKDFSTIVSLAELFKV